MTDLDKKKHKSELLRCQAAKAEMEFRIAEHLDAAERIKGQIIIQEAAEKKLLEKLGE